MNSCAMYVRVKWFRNKDGWVREYKERLEEDLFSEKAGFLLPGVDLVFFDTTKASFQRRDRRGFRSTRIHRGGGLTCGRSWSRWR